MNSAVESKRFFEDQKMSEAKNKILIALENDALGLSIAQLMTVCKLSVKTVKQALGELKDKVNEDLGVYSLIQTTVKSLVEPMPVKEPELKVEVVEKQKGEAKVEPEPKLKDETKINLRVKNGMQENVFNLLKNFKDGLTVAEITATLQTAEKPIHQAIYSLRKKHNIELKKLGKKHIYILHENTPPSIVKAPQLKPVLKTGIINELKAKMETKVVRKQKLSLTNDDIVSVLADVFGFDDIVLHQGGADLYKTEEVA